MGYAVGMKPGVSGPGEVLTGTAREALAQYVARVRQFGPAAVRDDQGAEISETTLRQRAGEEDAADRAKLRSGHA